MTVESGATGEHSRTAWVTGAGKGIGRALVQRLTEQGWTVVASARSADDLDSLAKSCPRGRVVTMPLDVTRPDDVAVALAAMEERLGRLDLAVLNAGTHRPMPAAEFTIDGVRDLVETNIMGTVNCLAPILERFRARRAGHVAVVASLAGYHGLPMAAAYGASKSALINMCEALAPDLEREGVALSVINPGFVKTPLTDRNDFSMPFLISAARAADAIVRGLEAKKFEIAFPTPFVLINKLLRILPYGLFFAITRRMLRS